MNKFFITCFILIILTGNYAEIFSQTLSASDIVRKADEKFNGEKSGISTMEMTIIRPAWERTVEFKSWTMGRENSLDLNHCPR